MTVIKQDDVIQSVADALQFISYYHPVDFIRAMAEAYEKEESPSAKAALQQVLVNSRMCALGKRPICQDTGIVIAFVEVGMDVQWEADMSLEDMVNEGVRRGYTFEDNVLRGSVLTDPDGARANTKDNTPGVVYTRVVPGDKVSIEVADACLNHDASGTVSGIARRYARDDLFDRRQEAMDLYARIVMDAVAAEAGENVVTFDAG